MKQSLWNKHIENTSVLAFGNYEIKEDRSNLSAFFCADVVGNRRFAQNYGGYPRSDIAEINAQVSMEAANNLLRDLQVFDVSDANSGLNDSQILLGLKSKYLQTQSEMVGYVEEQLMLRDAQRASQVKSDSQIQFSSNDNPNTPDNE